MILRLQNYTFFLNYTNFLSSFARRGSSPLAAPVTAKAIFAHAFSCMINQKIQELQAQIEELQKQIKD